MNILHVLSQIFVSGPEFYVAALARHHQKQEHEITIMSDTFTAPVNAMVIQAPIHQRDVRRRLSNISAVRKVIHERGIDVVHAHSRAASWVCFWAVKGTDVPLGINRSWASAHPFFDQVPHGVRHIGDRGLREHSSAPD